MPSSTSNGAILFSETLAMRKNSAKGGGGGGLNGLARAALLRDYGRAEGGKRWLLRNWLISAAASTRPLTCSADDEEEEEETHPLPLADEENARKNAFRRSRKKRKKKRKNVFFASFASFAVIYGGNDREILLAVVEIFSPLAISRRFNCWATTPTCTRTSRSRRSRRTAWPAWPSSWKKGRSPTPD